MTTPGETYLGDGVYASFDGYQFWLKTSDGVTITNEIALDTHVFAALVAYVKEVRERPQT
jgi:hypothetical protein